ncbi:chromate transporter [Dictyoglomus thermophilum]|uniref:Chromate transport protein n=1 Tax=Dictyoglomus thermophilum (strain ATCC 35947 / DSM 3960 / H-6-12) TaxID=309799 RepID=B5YBW2_DICT6|nr:chromate transporter [Dictyoglomus thermophilum]ACI19659.1 chromate transport protein [Dictyoglomus thermophilum H-6-12]
MGIYEALIKVFFKIGLFGFGGGYAIIALIRYLVVLEEKWLNDLEFIDVVAISQVTPGPIAINAATFIGYKMGGILGSLLATLSSVLAPFILVLFASYFVHKINQEKVKTYLTLLSPLTFSLIVAGTYSILKSSVLDFWGTVIFILSFILGYKYKWSLTKTLLFTGLLGEIIYFLVK